MTIRIIFLLLIALVSTAARAQLVLKHEPPPRTVPSGVRVFVDDGSCPSGQIKEIIGGNSRKGIRRTERCIASSVVRADNAFVDEPLRVPLPRDVGTLEALLVRPSHPGRYPLVLLSHGSPRADAKRQRMTPLAMLPQAREFARRGWAVLIVMRHGYGSSAGGWAEGYGSCSNPDYTAAGKAGAADLRLSLEFVSHRPDIDSTRMIAVGVSAGGFATVALTTNPPPGLVAAISFAGARGSPRANQVCSPDRLIEAFRAFGERSRIPMLWVYAANDHFFGPALAQHLREAFVAGGGNVDFVAAPAFGSDGHDLFSPAGIPIWAPYVDAFLQKQNLTLRGTPLPLPVPNIAAPVAAPH
jgi:dienelactone hydrolase